MMNIVLAFKTLELSLYPIDPVSVLKKLLSKGNGYEQWAEKLHISRPNFPEQSLFNIRTAAFKFFKDTVTVKNPAGKDTQHHA